VSMAKETQIMMDFFKMVQNGQLKASIDQLGQNITGLNQQLSSLNASMIAQNAQVTESITHTKRSVDELRNGFQGLNAELAKSNSYFERMDRSSQVMENLTKVIVVLTGCLIAIGMFPVLRELGFSVFEAWEYSCAFAGLVAIITIILLRIKEPRHH
jgi:hypothetical protein